jgi:hypothetical protein
MQDTMAIDMPTEIESGPESWFCSFQSTALPLGDGTRAEPRAMVTSDVVRAIVAAIKRGIQSTDISAAVRLPVDLVEIIDENRQAWVKQPPVPSKRRSNGRAKSSNKQKSKFTAPTGSIVVSPYKCGDHHSVFQPCLTCQVRKYQQNMAILAAMKSP